MNTKTFQQFEKVYAVLAMLFLANGLIPSMVAENDNVGQFHEPNMGDRIAVVTLYLILVPLLIKHWRRIFDALRNSGWIVALCGLALASTAWSFDAGFTLRRAITLSAMTLFAVYIGSCFDWDEQLDLFGWLSVVAVVGSALMVILVPAYGISHDIHSGSLKGLFPHRSVLARQMVFGILTLWLGKPKGLPVFVRNLTLFVGFILLVFSNAATSVVVLMVCLAMYPLLAIVKIPRRNTLPLWVPLAPLVAMVVFVFLKKFDLFLSILGRTPTLTGRTAIWDATILEIGKRPWLGWGYDVFWNRYTKDLAVVTNALQFRPPHAHDGYLDILLALGIVGMFLFLGGFLTATWRALQLFLADEVRGAKWPLFILLFFAIFNITESNILRPLTFLWIPYVAIYVSLALMRAEARHTASAKASSPESIDDSESERDGEVRGILPGYGT
jgi:exopolysaccharide production protein ExoQ